MNPARESLGAIARRVASIRRRISGAVSARPRTAIALTFVVAALPMVFLGSYVARQGVSVPMMDDWELAPVIGRAHTGQLTFSELFSQEEEARMMVPKLIFIASTWKGYWDVRDQMMLSIFICGATAVGIYILLRRSGLGLGASAVCFWLAVLLIFSPAQYELWLFASGFPSFMPVLFIVAALLLIETRLPVWAKFGGAAVLSLMSSFTLAHGLLAWGLTFPVYLAAHHIRRWKIWAAAWIAVATGCAVIYLHGYNKPEHLPEFAPVISFADYARFFLAFAGGGFAYTTRENREELAIAVGAVLLTLFVSAILYVIVRRREDSLVRRSLPWFALGLYSIGSGALATLGRVGFGLHYAISSRYVTFSVYLIVAVIVLFALLGSDIVSRSRSLVSRFAVVVVGACLLLTGVNLHAATFGRSMRILDSIAARNRLARAAFLFSPVLDSFALIKRINYPGAEAAVARALSLDRLELLRPPLLKTTRIDQLPHRVAGDELASGWCEVIEPLDEERARASGWAALNAKGRPADSVVLAYELPGQPPVIFAIADDISRRREIARSLRNPAQLWTGWSVTFRRDAVPAGASISAWAVDADAPMLYRLGQSEPELK